jgi:hypothetical protein
MGSTAVAISLMTMAGGENPEDANTTPAATDSRPPRTPATPSLRLRRFKPNADQGLLVLALFRCGPVRFPIPQRDRRGIHSSSMGRGHPSVGVAPGFRFAEVSRFVKLTRGGDEGEIRDPLAWIYKTAFNLAIDELRRATGEHQPWDAKPSSTRLRLES